MADDFWHCPNTGGEKPCNPACILFVREHTDIEGKRRPNYCRTHGTVDKILSAERLTAEEKGE